MKALVGAFNQEKALVGAFAVIVQPVVEPMEHYTALVMCNGIVIRELHWTRHPTVRQMGGVQQNVERSFLSPFIAI